MRLIVAFLLATALAACSATPDRPTEPAEPTMASAEPLTVELMDFMLDPATLEVTGPEVSIEVTNDGPTPHNLSIRDADGAVLAATADLSTGEAEELTLDLPAGNYVIFCSLGGHESLGMSGTLTVSDS